MRLRHTEDGGGITLCQIKKKYRNVCAVEAESIHLFKSAHFVIRKTLHIYLFDIVCVRRIRRIQNKTAAPETFSTYWTWTNSKKVLQFHSHNKYPYDVRVVSGDAGSVTLHLHISLEDTEMTQILAFWKELYCPCTRPACKGCINRNSTTHKNTIKSSVQADLSFFFLNAEETVFFSY